MRLIIGCDHAGVDLKRLLLTSALADHDVIDVGTHTAESVDYPDIASAAVGRLLDGEAELAILICGTGLGMSMAAGRHPGIRAALCSNSLTAEMSRRHNNANVLCMSARIIGSDLAERIVRIWLDTPFDGGRHHRRVQKIEDITPTC